MNLPYGYEVSTICPQRMLSSKDKQKLDLQQVAHCMCFIFTPGTKEEGAEADGSVFFSPHSHGLTHSDLLHHRANKNTPPQLNLALISGEAPS